jgi:hypothetical protein
MLSESALSRFAAFSPPAAFSQVVSLEPGDCGELAARIGLILLLI